MGPFRSFARVFLVSIAAITVTAALSACQSSGATQEGSESSTASPVRAISPTDQAHSINVGGSTSNVIMPVSGTTPDGKPFEVHIETSVRVGSSADGDVKGQGRSEGGALSDGKTLSQAPQNTTSLDPKAIADAATSILATAVPGGQAATLAQTALDALRGNDKVKAAEALAKAQAAAKVEKPPAGGSVDPGK